MTRKENTSLSGSEFSITFLGQFDDILGQGKLVFLLIQFQSFIKFSFYLVVQNDDIVQRHRSLSWILILFASGEYKKGQNTVRQKVRCCWKVNS